jgi:hypothetical protein
MPYVPVILYMEDLTFILGWVWLFSYSKSCQSVALGYAMYGKKLNDIYREARKVRIRFPRLSLSTAVSRRVLRGHLPDHYARDSLTPMTGK